MEVWLLNKLSLLVPNICIENSMENMPTYVGVTRVKKHVFKSEYTLHSNLFFQFSFNNFTKFCCIGQAPFLINLWKARHKTP